jgi:Amidohydrolase
MMMMMMRKATAAYLLCLLACLLPIPSGHAQTPLKLFDAHLHYNWEPTPLYELDKVLEIFKRNNVAGILATSRPNAGTHALVDAKAPGLWVVPFIRPYRVRSDIQSWFNDPSIYELVQDEYKRGHYRGIGEFHIYGKSATTEWVKKIVDFAVERDLYLHAHCDEEALVILFGQNPRAKIIWAHTGFSTPPSRVAELLDTYPALWGELSYRSGITEAGGKLSPGWRDLFAKYSDRFLIGSDTWINERWFQYDNLMREYRSWLSQLPEDQARRIAHGNAERLFGGKVE